MSKKIQITTASELINQDVEELKYFIQHLAVQGLTLLAAAPKVGKSFLINYLGYCIATGQKTFGKLNTKKSKVLLLALEDNPRRIKKRLHQIAEASLLGSVNVPDDLHIVTSIEGKGNNIDTIKQLILDNKYDVIFVDILQRIVKPEDTGSYKKEYALIKKLKGLADRTNTAIIAVHHTNKKTSKASLDAISGTRGLVGACDNVIVLSRTSEESAASRRGTLEMSVQGRDLDSNCFYLEYGTKQGFYTISEEEPIRESKQEKIDQAWQLNEQGFKQDEIAKLMGDISQGYVSKLINEKKRQLNKEGGQNEV